jgi:hypothetical protein
VALERDRADVRVEVPQVLPGRSRRDDRFDGGVHEGVATTLRDERLEPFVEVLEDIPQTAVLDRRLLAYPKARP